MERTVLRPSRSAVRAGVRSQFDRERGGETIMLIGAHSIIYSRNPEADRAFLRDVLELPNIDVGDGWLIFGLPPAELAVHPSNKNNVHEFYLMCDDVKALIAEMDKRNIACSPVQKQSWGLLTQVTLPGGGKLGIYQPSHARPKRMSVGKSARKAATREAKKTARETPKKKAKSRSLTF
jgi:hypothetical protein